MASKSPPKARSVASRSPVVTPAAIPPAITSDLRPALHPELHPELQTEQQTESERPLNFHTNVDFWRGRGMSFAAALEGVVYIVRTQPNVWIELVALSAVMAAGWWFGLGALEWALLGLTVAMILALEAVNTAIETVVDLVSPHYHPLAKIAKDTAAGALIIAVAGSVFVAACIFGPRLWALFFA